MMTEDVVVGIDIGGSHIGYGYLSRKDHKILHEYHELLDNSKQPDDLLNQIISSIKNALEANVSWHLVAAGNVTHARHEIICNCSHGMHEYRS